ncbi:MAG: hypothetical protein A49_03760 [Methyloceanibacter sp.]|nr:MAG: hypothetical protein A49_03760 [Methyloceanibacter sp.]
MTDPIPFDHRLTDEEFVRFGLNSDNPVVRECARRLDGYETDATIEAGNLRDEIEDLEKELKDVDERIADAVEKATAGLEDTIFDLQEQLAHELTRVEEFARESAAHRDAFTALQAEYDKSIAEGARASADTPPKAKESPMTLEDRLGALLAEQERTNDLLTCLLEAFNAGGAPEKGTEPATGKAGARKPANDDTPAENEEAPEETAAADESEPDEAPTFDDVRVAFLAYRDKHGKDAAITLVRGIAGNIAKISGVPEDKYAEVVAALKEGVDDDSQEAA